MWSNQATDCLLAGSANTVVPCTSMSTTSGLASCGSALAINLMTTTDSIISAPCLSSVLGTLYIFSTGMPNNALKSIQFPSLTYVGGPLSITNSANSVNSALTFVDVHNLHSVSGSLGISYNSVLTWLDLSQLTYVGTLAIQFCASLTSVSLPSLSSILGSVQISSNAALTSLYFPALSYITSGLQISGHATLTSVVMNVLSGVSSIFYIYSNNKLAILSVDALTYVGQYVYVSSNGDLTSLAFRALTYVANYVQVDTNIKLMSLATPAIVKVANLAGSLFAVSICANAAALSYSPALAYAAAGQPCHLVSSCVVTAPCPCLFAFKRSCDRFEHNLNQTLLCNM